MAGRGVRVAAFPALPPRSEFRGGAWCGRVRQGVPETGLLAVPVLEAFFRRSFPQAFSRSDEVKAELFLLVRRARFGWTQFRRRIASGLLRVP